MTTNLRHNVQLGESERTIVYFSTKTKRILCFGPPNMKPLLSEGYTSIELTSARQIERYAEQMRREFEEDAQEALHFKTMRDEPIRKELRAALLARRNVCTPLQQRYIDVNIEFMDRLRERTLKTKTQNALVSEMYTSDTPQEEIALDSPGFRADPAN